MILKYKRNFFTTDR